MERTPGPREGKSQRNSGKWALNRTPFGKRAVWAGFVLIPSFIFLLSACSEAEFDNHQTFTGILNVRILDQPSGSQKQYLLESGVGKRIILNFETDPHLISGEKVEITGVSHGKNTLAVRSLQMLTRKPRRLDTPLVRSPMQHRVAILAMQEASITEQKALNLVTGAVDSVDNFYAVNSQNIDTFSAKVFKRYNISYTASDCEYDNTGNIENALINAFKNDGNNTSDYDHIVLVVPTKCGKDWSGAWAYVGSIGDDGGVGFSVVSMYKDDCFDPWYLSHELGHNLGMNHARSMKCSGALYKPNGAGCSFDEYGNYNDVMGNGEGVYFSAPYQRFMGWIAAANVATAGKSGTFNLQPADGSMCGVRAVRIPIPGETGNYFYVEYRRARSDSRYAGTGEFGSTRQNAVLITRSADGTSGNSSSSTDRVELGTSQYQGAKQGVRYDFGGGVAVKVLSMTGSYAEVSIEMPGSAGHRNDSGAEVFVETDGSNGPKACVNNDDSDACPSDPNKTQPGVCGCGTPDTNSDGDGAPDCKDNCPNDPSKTQPGVCGCGKAEGTCGSTCVDNPNFVDAQNYACSSWVGYDCNRAVEDWSYTEAQEIEILSNCKLSCNSCSVTDQCPNDPNKTEPGSCGCGVPEGSCGGVDRCAEADEGATLALSCSAGQTITSIRFASYGVPTGSCPNLATGSCHASSSKSKVESACLNKQSCTVGANNGVFGDPCVGTRKKLAVVYACSGGGVDNCPNDPNKTEPGSCGCGVAEGTCGTTCVDNSSFTDAQGYGCLDWVGYDCNRAVEDYGYTAAQETAIVSNCKKSCNLCSPGDLCPNDPNKTEPGLCGCGKAEGTCGGSTYNVYYGMLHNHTNISDGTGTPAAAYKYARDVQRNDCI
ncbi:MAG: M12 family metallo-peptidase [Myxococcota bacterium]|nr:M12 family metallo-peptidase [Myxococcota bacterium]